MASNSIAKLQHQVAMARKSTQRAREKAGELMSQALETGLSGGTAYAFGVWEGSISDADYKRFELFGVPAPLAVGIGAHAAALFGVGKGMEQHFRSVGNGAISAHLFALGRQMGRGMLAKKGGAPSAIRGDGVSAADLVNLARG